MKSTIEWVDGTPPVPMGGIGYYLVVTEKSKTAFGAFYLNEHLLTPRDDCPSATPENDFTPCPSCDNGDGHRFTGWYEEKEDSEGDVFMPLDASGPHAPIKWALMPENPFHPTTKGGE